MSVGGLEGRLQLSTQSPFHCFHGHGNLLTHLSLPASVVKALQLSSRQVPGEKHSHRPSWAHQRHIFPMTEKIFPCIIAAHPPKMGLSPRKPRISPLCRARLKEGMDSLFCTGHTARGARLTPARTCQLDAGQKLSPKMNCIFNHLLLTPTSSPARPSPEQTDAAGGPKEKRALLPRGIP